MADFAWVFGSSSRSDVDLVLVEEEGDDGDKAAAAAAQGGDDGGDSGAASAAAVGAKRSRPRSRASHQGEQQQQEEIMLPAHSLVLMANSGFCKAKLENWAAVASGGACGDDDGNQAQDQQPSAATKRRRRGEAAAGAAAPPTNSSSSTRPRVVLHVPRGQLSLGRRLVRAMYEAAPALGDLGADELVQLLLLADRYDAPRVVAAAAVAAGVDVAVVAQGGVDWALMHAGFKEPAASSTSASAPLCAALLAVANAALQRQLGDLELVWADAGGKQRRQRLLALPFGAVKALLASDETRVASENTAFYTVQRWLDFRGLTAADARAKELLGLLRVARMTPHYARTVFCSSALAKAHLSSQKLAMAGTLPLVDVSKTSFDSATINKHPSWLMPARPRSALADGVMQNPEVIVWQGWPLQLSLKCELSAGGGLTLALFLRAKQLCREAVAVVTYTLEAAAREDGISVSRGTIMHAFADSSSYGYGDVFRLGKDGATPPRDWAGLEAALRGKGVVHVSGGEGEGGGVAAAHVKLRARVTRLE